MHPATRSARGLWPALLLSTLMASGALALAPSPSDFDGGIATGELIRSELHVVAPVGPRSTDVLNVNTSTTFSTIQDAINDAGTLAGHVLEVQVPSHAEGIVQVTKSVTIRGGGGGAVLTPTTNTGSSGDARGWFLVTAPNVVFRDLDFDGTGFLIWQAIRYNPGSSGLVERCDFLHIGGTASSYDGRGVATVAPVTVRECAFTDMRRIGVHIFGPGAAGTVVERCVYTGKGAGDWLDYGVEIGGGAVATIADNTISACTGVAGDGSGSAGVLITDYFAPGSAGTLTGNIVTGCSAAVADGFLAGDLSVTIAHGNDFAGNAYGVASTNPAKVVDASANWWGSNAAAVVAASAGAGVDFTPWLHVGTDTGVADGFQGSYAVLDVDDDSPQTGATGRIQEGVDLVTASTVYVMPGTYVEQVVVNGMDVVIQGSGKASTFIHSPITLATQFLTPSPNKPIVAAMNAADVQVLDLTIDGLGRGNGNSRMSGVAFWNAGGKVLGCDILNIRETPFSGAQHGVGVYAFNDTGGPYALEVGNCVATGYQKNAMALSGAGLTVDVHDCVATGAGDTNVIAQNGIQVSYGANGTVADCSVSAMRWTGATWTSSGMLVFQSGTLGVTNLTAVDAQEAVYWADASGSIQGLDVSYPTSAPDYEAVLFYDTTPAPLRAAADRAQAAPFEEVWGGGPAARATTTMTVALDDGCITGTGAAGTAGVYAYSELDALTIDVSNLRVTNFDYGFVAWGPLASVDALDCSISGNLSAGYDCTGSPLAQDVRHNWWGDATGPSGLGMGAGDAVNGAGANFSGWRVDGLSSTACAFTPTTGLNTIQPTAPVGCITPATPCVTVPIDIQRYDGANLRGFSVEVTLSPELMLCSGAASIVEDTYLSSISGTTFQVVDNGGGSYTVDGSILGLPCGQTAGTGTLFTMDVKKSGIDGTGTITVGDVLLRDCVNAPIAGEAGAAASITIDTAGPAAIAGLSAVQKKTGNTIGQDTTGVTVTFTAPLDAVMTEVYAAPYGNYPEYDDAPGSGSVPSAPAYPPTAPWVLTAVTATGQHAYLEDRDFWYFVAFTKDACGNVSAVSNVAGGKLNYHLGDVTDGSTLGHGDNHVNGADVSALGASYGITLGVSDPLGYLDVGPTTNFSVDARPTTDNKVNFEDLMMFAINFGQVGRVPVLSPVAALLRDPRLALEIETSGDRVRARLMLRDHTRLVQGVHATVAFDAAALELVGVTEGGLASSQGPSFLGTIPEANRVAVDVARLGHGSMFEGEGEVAVVEFRRIAGAALPALAEVALRDATNRPASRRSDRPDAGEQATLATEPAIADVQLVGARPNPFRGATEIVFRLPSATHVSLRIHDVTGRLVRTLENRTMNPGEQVVRWDGRSSDGSVVASGIYFYTFRAGDVRETRKIIHAR